MKSVRERIYKVSIAEQEGGCLYVVEVRAPRRAAVTVAVDETVFVALDELQRELWRNNKREERHSCSLDVIPMSRIPLMAFPRSPEELYFARVSIDELETALDQIPEIQRHRFLLRYMQGMTAREIAHIEGCSEQAIGHSLALARKNLQEILSSGV